MPHVAKYFSIAPSWTDGPVQSALPLTCFKLKTAFFVQKWQSRLYRSIRSTRCDREIFCNMWQLLPNEITDISIPTIIQSARTWVMGSTIMIPKSQFPEAAFTQSNDIWQFLILHGSLFIFLSLILLDRFNLLFVQRFQLVRSFYFILIVQSQLHLIQSNY